MIRRVLLVIALATFGSLAPHDLAGQAAPLPSADAAEAPPSLSEPPAMFAPGPRRAEPVRVIPPEVGRVPPLLATTSSMVVPGLGQLMMRQRRWTAYAGLELAGWLLHLDRLRQGRRYRALYRNLAWAVARGMPQPREEAEWAYYETLGSWPRSGAFDLDAARAGLQPETDEESYNGAIWSLARDLYLPQDSPADSVGFAKAVAYYERRAIRPGFLWDWKGQEESLELYRDVIHKSDESLRTATVVLGAVVANHLFSAVDAFVSSRLGHESPVGAAVGWRPLGGEMQLEWRVEVRR